MAKAKAKEGNEDPIETVAQEEKKAPKKKASKKEKTSDPTKKDFTGPRLHGKKYRLAASMIDQEKQYTLAEAVPLAKASSTVKFDASVEIHLNMSVDPKQADQQLRGIVALPHGTGKKLKIVAFVGEDKIKECKEAGAMEAGTTNLLEKITKGWLDFDMAVATPDQMKELGKIAKTLGQAGKMPNPKAGTVTPTPAKTIQEISKGQVEYRVDKDANLHNIVGKTSFDESKLLENVKTYLQAIMRAKPAGVKGNYINSITLATTMGPGIKVFPNEASAK